MRASIRSSTISRLAGAIAALWIGGVGPASAGGGSGEDLGSLNALLTTPGTGLCAIFKMSSCPPLPTVTQAVLQVAGLGNNLPEMVRAQNNIPPGNSVTAGNPAAAPPLDLNGSPLPMPFPLNSTTNPPLFVAGNATTPPSGLLSTLTPLAFVSQSSGTAQPTQLYNSTADIFLYAVGVSSFGFVVAGANLTDADTVYFFYDDGLLSNQNFSSGQIVAKFSFLLAVLNKDGTERAVPTTLQFTATNAGDCSASTVVGDFKGNGTSQTLLANTIGINCAVVFSASPTSPQNQNHAIFEVAVPAVVTGACVLPNAQCPTGQTPPGPNTDPAYFYGLHNGGKTNPINTGVFTAFLFDDPGDTPSKSGILGPRGNSIGLAPSAVPFCTATTCPPPPQTPPANSLTFSLCASLPNSNTQLRPAVGAYYAMATSGETLLSAPLPSAFTSGGTPPVCPKL
jgi:hypothetical protein